MRKLSARSRFIVLIFIVCGMTYSCNNSIDPIDKKTGIYAIYGVLDLNKQTNYIRVRDLNAPFTLEATRDIDAQVTIENLQTDSVMVLKSERQEYQGIYVHNFEVNDEIQQDNVYRLTVERSDGAAVNMTITTPTQPDPQVMPLNQNCYVPIDFELSPLNGSTVVLRVGFLNPDRDPDDKFIWGRRHVLKMDSSHSSAKVNFTFTPHVQVNEILAFSADRKCGDWLLDGNIYISYIHFGPDFYERVSEEPFDIFRSIELFGAAYFDTLTIPVDTSPVCPQDC